MHCGILVSAYGSHFDLRLSNPVDLHGLALKYLSLPFIIPHFGSGYFREALMLASSATYVYLDTAYPGAGVGRAAQVVGAERLLFGTDSSFFPRGWNGAIFDQQMEVVKSLELPESAIECIVRRNFAEIFQIG